MLLTGVVLNYSKEGEFIPKKDAEPSLIRNLRLITLLNCDHKIVAKALANHVKTFLPKWKVETGFMKYWIIGDNIRLIDGIIYYTVDEKLPWLLLFLDFQKAFDTVEWSYIKKNTLGMFGFGPSIVNWIKICYNNIENCVLNSGWSTDFILSWRGELEKVAPFRFTFLCWSSCQKKSEKKYKRNNDIPKRI